MPHTWLGVLSASPMFRGIDPSALDRMLICLAPRLARYKVREIIAASGSPFAGIGIVVRGEVAITRETYEGNRVIIDILGPHEIFGEVVAFSNEDSWPVTVIAREDCCLLFMSPSKILGNCANICPAHHTLIFNLLNILSGKIMMLNRKLEHLSAKRIRGKLSSYLLAEYRRQGRPKLVLPLKRHELADYLSIPRPSLSREMGRMQDEGLLEYKGPQVKLNDVMSLERVAK